MRVAEFAADVFSGSDLAERTVERRAVETVNWGIPAVNFDRMRQAMVRAGGAFNHIVYWSRLTDWKNQTLSPNPDVIYVMPFINTRDVGPMVLEIPRADEGTIAGTVTDCWQGALEDVGATGVDKGRGGKYLILPPDYRDEVPGDHIALRSSYFQNYGLLRSVLKSGSDGDVASAVAHAKRIRLYPLSEAAAPPPTAFVDVADVVFDGTIPYDLRFFQSLDRVVQIEPWQTRDKVMIDVLKSIGIEKGKAFTPNPKLQETLQAAAREARASFNARFETAFPPFYSGEQWIVVAPPEIMETMGTFYEKPEMYAVDARGSRVLLRVLQRQASRRRSVLSVVDEGQERAVSGWWEHVSAHRAAECSSQAVLVGGRLRSLHPRVHQERHATRPFLAEPGNPEEGRWFNRHLLRPRVANRKTVELDPDAQRRAVRSLHAFLRAG